MQKKVTNAKNKKASSKDASYIKNRQSIFNYDLEVPDDTKANRKLKNNIKKEKYIDAEEIPKINRKKLEKVKKKKRKERIKREKEIRKQEKLEEKQRIKNRKKSNPKLIAKRKKTMKIVEILFLILLVITAILLFLLSPVFKITNIQVKGNEKISADEIISLSKIEKEINLFKINKKEIESYIKQNSYIENVKINRKMPGSIEIIVEERKAEFEIEVGGGYAYIDNNGYILEINSENLEDKLKILGYKTKNEDILEGNRLCQEDIDNLKTVISILNVAENYQIKQKITSFNIENDANFIVELKNENKIVHLGDTTNIDIKMLYLQSILEKEKEKSGVLHLNVDFRNKFPYASWK